MEIERRYDDCISHMRLTAAEFVNKGQGFSSLQLMPGTAATGISPASLPSLVKSAPGSPLTTRTATPFKSWWRR